MYKTYEGIFYIFHRKRSKGFACSFYLRAGMLFGYIIKFPFYEDMCLEFALICVEFDKESLGMKYYKINMYW